MKELCGAKTRAGGKCKKSAMTNGRCRFHGGKTLRGVASPVYKHGKYSKVPANLLPHYERFLSDPDILKLDPNIALLDSMIDDQLGQLDSVPSKTLWGQVSAHYRNLQIATDSDDADKFLLAMAKLKDAIAQGFAQASGLDRVVQLSEQKRKMVESEHKHRVQDQLMITIEQASVVNSAIVASYWEAITGHVPVELARKIQTLATEKISLIIEGEKVNG